MTKMILPTKLQDTIDNWMWNLEDFSEYENHGTQIDEIEHEHVSGFIPFTNGGYRAMILATLSCAKGSGSYPEIMQTFIDNEDDEIITDFCLEKGIHLEEGQTIWDIINSEDAPTDLEEQFYQFEMEYTQEGGFYWYEYRIMFYSSDNMRNELGGDEIRIMAGTNTDFEYGRDCGLDTTYDKRFLVSDLTPASFEEHLNNALYSI